MRAIRLAGGHQVVSREPSLGQRCGRDGPEPGAHGSRTADRGEQAIARLVGISTATVFFALGLLHVYWAAGGKWGTDVTIPKQDGTPLFQPPRAGTSSGGDPPLLRGSCRVGPTRAVGRRPAVLAVCRWELDSRGGLPRSSRGRRQVVWRLQADERDSLRLVGHLALRSALSSSRPWMPGRGPQEELRLLGSASHAAAQRQGERTALAVRGVHGGVRAWTAPHT